MVEWRVPDQTTLWHITDYSVLKFVDGRIVVGKERLVDKIQEDGKNLLVNKNFETKKYLYPVLNKITEYVVNTWVLNSTK